jgi:hypothetical protein
MEAKEYLERCRSLNKLRGLDDSPLIGFAGAALEDEGKARDFLRLVADTLKILKREGSLVNFSEETKKIKELLE